MTHIQKLDLETHNGIVLIRGETPVGDPIYAYVKVDLHDVEELEKAYEQDLFIDYSRYKGIIKHDWGEEPPTNVKRYMEEHYDFHHHDE